MEMVLLRTTLATLIAFIGATIAAALGKVDARRLRLLVYAAMGVLLGITVCDILPDAKQSLSWPAFLLSAASGWVLFWLFGKYLGPLCPACAMSAFGSRVPTRLGQTVVLLMAGLGLHSTMDGLAVVVGDELSGHANLAVLLGVSFHKLPEGLALVLVLIGAGFNRRQALAWGYAIEATTELGGLLGLFALRSVPVPLLAAIFGHIGGGFLYLILSTFGLFASSHGSKDRRLLPSAPSVASGGLGFAATAILIWIFSHSV